MINDKYSNLKAELVKRGIKQSEIADKIKMDRTTFNIKINRYNGRDFTLSEAYEIANILNITIDDFF